MNKSIRKEKNNLVMANKKYTPEQISDKEFQVVPNGYRAEEVDAFVDELNQQISDQIDQINTLSETLEDKSSELNRLKIENEKIRNEINDLQSKDNAEVTNTFSSKQVLKKLASIENGIGQALVALGVDENKK